MNVINVNTVDKKFVKFKEFAKFYRASFCRFIAEKFLEKPIICKCSVTNITSKSHFYFLSDAKKIILESMSLVIFCYLVKVSIAFERLSP